jgi:hypothetical protein
MVLVKRFEKSPTIEKFLRWWNKSNVRCDICGKWVEDTEVPLHVTSRGSCYVHPLHIIISEKGRDLINKFCSFELND